MMQGAEQLLEGLRGLHVDDAGAPPFVECGAYRVYLDGTVCRRSLVPFTQELQLPGAEERHTQLLAELHQVGLSPKL